LYRYHQKRDMKFKNSNILVIVLLIFCLGAGYNHTCAQDDYQGSLKGAPLKERLFYGGGLGLQVGSITLIDVSPMIGYKLSNRIGIGVSPTYKYYHWQDYFGKDLDLKTNVFGGSVFARCYVYQGLFAQSEYEYLRYKYDNPASSGKFTNDIWSLFIGGGYSQPLGGRASMYIMALWNLHDTQDSPYNNPLIRIGMSLGF